ncbi:AraC family transcriptional regulator [Lysinibacillus macroides]|uniref:Transcriptional regulator n=1 Tax=Lysinibacillus macroides TaxID=33935 RepID=A0A0M9DJA4_9BACI|nr:effector binding domain-containing protein [Lysinibacillus macroides]KOY81530.1 transcriptional regulator [Lysinibacillus macroides]QPR69635.1 AraC family transcriptional regulator [Lysinibacillus macroides]
MDYFERIQHAIDYIEEHLEDKLTITHIAAQSYFSAFHFQRLFQAITGFSVQQYIRKRRLSEAAVLLATTAHNILEIAIRFQYGSQEAFTRAFVQYMGITPAKYRKRANFTLLQAKINFLDYKMEGALPMQKPAIIHLPSKKITGYIYETFLQDEQYYNDILGFYLDFGQNQYYEQLSHKAAPNMAYGISTNFQENGEFSFIVGEEVHTFEENLAAGFFNLEIPAGKYAEFTVNSTAKGIQNTRRYIYGVWLPNSNYERDTGPDFEITDVMHSIYPHDMKMKIYIPIKEY